MLGFRVVSVLKGFVHRKIISIKHCSIVSAASLECRLSMLMLAPTLTL